MIQLFCDISIAHFHRDHQNEPESINPKILVYDFSYVISYSGQEVFKWNR